MKKPPKLSVSREDCLRAENEVLKLKLELEHGMREFGSALAPELENAWLKNICEFEKHARNAKKIKLYDFLGRPPVSQWSTLAEKQVTDELEKLMTIMAQNHISTPVHPPPRRADDLPLSYRRTLHYGNR